MAKAWQDQNLMGVDQQAEDPGKSCRVQRQTAGSIPFCLGEFSLFLVKPSTDWMRPTHIMEGNLLYSKYTDFNVNLT